MKRVNTKDHGATRGGRGAALFFFPLSLGERVAKLSQRVGAKRRPMINSAKLSRVINLSIGKRPRRGRSPRHLLPLGEKGRTRYAGPDFTHGGRERDARPGLQMSALRQGQAVCGIP